MHRKIALSGLATVAVATGGILTGVSPASASSGGTISVVYQIQGGNQRPDESRQYRQDRVPAEVPRLDRQPRADHLARRERVLHQARP